MGQEPGSAKRKAEDTMKRELHSRINELGPDCEAVITRIVGRLEGGQKQYGTLDAAKDPRNWKTEGDEELLDWLVYRELERMTRPSAAELDTRIGEAMDLLEGDYNEMCCATDCFLLARVAKVLRGGE